VGRSSTAAHFGNVPGAKYMPVEPRFCIGCRPCPTWGTRSLFSGAAFGLVFMDGVSS
jgi:hypothetical protein